MLISTDSQILIRIKRTSTGSNELIELINRLIRYDYLCIKDILDIEGMFKLKCENKYLVLLGTLVLTPKQVGT